MMDSALINNIRFKGQESHYIDKKDRLHWIDIMKGLLILLLLIHHFGSVTRRLGGFPTQAFFFVYCWQDIYTCFFMQTFLFISGFCSSFSIPISVFISKLIKQLIVPFVIFEFIICIVSSALNSEVSVKAFYNYWIESNGTHLWFLNALIFSKSFIYIITRFLTKSISFLYLMSILLFVVAIIANSFDIGYNFLCIRNSFASALFVVIGYHFKNDLKLFVKLQRLGYLFPYILLFLLMFNIPIPMLTASIGFGIKGIPVFLVTSFCGTMACVLLCKCIKENRFLEYWGRNSLVVYCTHFIPLFLTIKYLYVLLSPGDLIQRIIFVVTVYVIELIILYLFTILFSYKPFKYAIGNY